MIKPTHTCEDCRYFRAKVLDFDKKKNKMLFNNYCNFVLESTSNSTKYVGRLEKTTACEKFEHKLDWRNTCRKAGAWTTGCGVAGAGIGIMVGIVEMMVPLVVIGGMATCVGLPIMIINHNKYKKLKAKYGEEYAKRKEVLQ